MVAIAPYVIRREVRKHGTRRARLAPSVVAQGFLAYQTARFPSCTCPRILIVHPGPDKSAPVTSVSSLCARRCTTGAATASDAGGAFLALLLAATERFGFRLWYSLQCSHRALLLISWCTSAPEGSDTSKHVARALANEDVLLGVLATLDNVARNSKAYSAESSSAFS